MGSRRVGLAVLKFALLGALGLSLASCDFSGPHHHKKSSSGSGADLGAEVITCSVSCTVTGASAAVTVGAEGGTVLYTPAGAPAGVFAKLTIPAGALSGDTTLTLTPAVANPADPTVEPTLVFDLGPEGLTFATPVTLEIGYAPEDLTVAETLLKVATVESGEWAEVVSTLDTDAHTLTTQIPHFSQWAGRQHDAVAPTAVTAPVSGSAMQDTHAVVIHFNERIDPASVTLGGTLLAETYNAAWSATNHPDDTLTLTPTVAWTEGADQTVTVAAADIAGNALNGGPASATFTIDDTPAGITLAPVNGTTIAAGAQIALMFDEAMDPTTFSLGGTLAAQAAAPVWTSGSHDNDQVVLSPATPWGGGSQTLLFTVADVAGNSLQYGPFSYTVDTQAPTVLSVTPASGVLIDSAQALTITFSEAVDTSTLALSGSMTGSGQVQSPATGAAWNVGNTVLTLTPTGAWTAGSGRDLTLNVSDLVGNPLSALTVSYDIISPSVYASPSGSDDNSGLTQADPVQTVKKALAVAQANGLSWVALQAGTYAGPVHLTSGINIQGGFDGSWHIGSHTDANFLATITGGLDSGAGNTGLYLAVTGSALAATTISNLQITGPDAAGVTAGGISQSAYGVVLINSTVTLSAVDIVAGNGTNGTDGANGTTSTAAVLNGNAGGGAANPGGLCNTTARGAGGLTSGGSIPGAAGGAGGLRNHDCDIFGGGESSSAGIAGNTATGGVGGNGTGGAGGGLCAVGQPGNPGAPGANSNGGTGLAAGGTVTAQGVWQPAPQVRTTSGGNGKGGGGGGGSGGCSGKSFGAGGGSGGAGGIGGLGGVSGKSAGASIGVMAASSTVTFSNGSTITRGAGGTGGNGGNGAAGQLAGTGGSGGPAGAGSLAGGNGGAGGAGGASGAGAGGAGGGSYGYILHGTTSAMAGSVTVSGGTAGSGGTGGAGIVAGGDGGTGAAGELLDNATK